MKSCCTILPSVVVSLYIYMCVADIGGAFVCQLPFHLDNIRFGTPTNIHRTNVHRTNPPQTNPPQDKRTPGTNPPQGQTYTRDKPTPRQTYTRDKPTPRQTCPRDIYSESPPHFFSFHFFQYIFSFVTVKLSLV